MSEDTVTKQERIDVVWCMGIATAREIEENRVASGEPNADPYFSATTVCQSLIQHHGNETLVGILSRKGHKLSQEQVREILAADFDESIHNAVRAYCAAPEGGV